MTAKRHWLCRVLLGSTLLCGANTALSAGEPQLALIIDDLGYSLDHGRRVIALPGPLTVAVLPFTPNAAALAHLAVAAGKDVILHQPMQAVDALAFTPDTLTATMSGSDLRTRLRDALTDVPHAIGVSNHTGSLLTTQRAAMLSLMKEVHAHGLFFIDSRTTAGTVALDVAIQSGVPALRRDVFLDNSLDPDAIAAEFERAITIARERGHAVLIAHPHEQSLIFLEAALPALAARGISQVPLTRLLEVVSAKTLPAQNSARESPRTTPVL